jgi:hypothetical protein
MCRFPGNVVLTLLRAQLVMLQGIWFIQIAEILFKGELRSSIADSLSCLTPLHACISS